MDNTLKKVIWAEGVLLGQQHLQHWDKYHRTKQKILHRSIAPLAFGLTELEIDPEALLNGVFRIKRCTAIYPDGALVQYDEAEDYELSCKLDLSLGSTTDSISIYLGMPINQRVAGITGYKNPQQICTWIADYQTVKDCYDPEREREIMFGRLNLTLLQNDDNQDQFYVIKTAELINNGENNYSLVKNFIPTVIHIKVALFLQNTVKRFLEIISDKIRVITETNNLLLLQTLTSALIQLQHIFKHPDTHPEQLFLTLANLAGQLCVFKENFALIDLPIYQHSDLTSSFTQLETILLELLDSITPTRTTAIKLQRKNDSLYMVDNIDASLLDQAEFFLSVYLPTENINWVEQFTHQIKIASQAAINQLVAAALSGVLITHVQHPPDQLTTKPGYEYFHLELVGNFWEQIKTDKNLAIFLPNDFIAAKIALITTPK